MLIEKASHKGTISIWFYSYEILRLGKSREEKITSGHQGEQVRVQALEDDSWEVQSFWWGSDGDVLKLIVVQVEQLCEYTKKQWILHFRWVNCMMYKLYLNKGFNFFF